MSLVDHVMNFSLFMDDVSNFLDQPPKLALRELFIHLHGW